MVDRSKVQDLLSDVITELTSVLNEVTAVVAEITTLINTGRDEVDDAAIGITLEHHEIHEGNHYSIGVATNSAGTLSLSFKTSTTKVMHMVVSYATESKAHLNIVEGVTVTATTGTEVTVYNRNRNSDKAPTMLQNKSGAFVANSKVLQDATVANGTSIAHHQHWGDKKSGGERRGMSERELKLDTEYQMLVTSDDGDKGLHLMLDWYEVSV